MINVIQNTIGALARRASTAASIITQNLQLWLGFTKADVLGAELVENGDFSLGSDDWWNPALTPPNSVVFNANNSVTLTSVDSNVYIRQSNVLDIDTTYSITYTIDSASADINVLKLVSSLGIAVIPTSNGTHTVVGTAISTTLYIERTSNGVNATISNISIKEVSQFAPDKSTNTNNAKLFTGKALGFDGVNDLVDLSNPNINLKSICFWVNLDTTSEQIFNLTSTHNITASSGVITLVGTWSNSNIYVDGVATTSIGTTPKRVVITTDTNILVNDLEFAKIGSDYGALSLADVQIYDAELSLPDALIDYNNPNDLVFNKGGSVALANLVGYWALSEGSGSIAYDSSGGGNNGTITGATYDDKQPTIPQLGMMDWSNTSGKTLIEAPNNVGYDILGNALRLREGGFNLDGSGYGSIASDATLTAITTGTIQFWLKTSTTKFSVLNGQTSSEFIGQTDSGVWTDGNAGTITAYKDGSTANTSPVYDGDWHFYTFTGVNLSTWTSFLISNLTAFELDCIIDELLIYSDVLTATEIDNNFNVSSATHS